MTDETQREDQNQIPIANYLPYISSFIIFLGITRLTFFYSVFGISIVSFLDFSEIITSFLDIIVIAVFLFACSFLQGFIMHGKKDIDEANEIWKKIISENNFIKRLWLHIKHNAEVLFGGLFTTVIFLIWHFINKEIPILNSLWYLLTFLIFFTLLIFYNESRRRHHQLNSTIHYKRFTMMLFITVILTGLVIYTAYQQALNIKENKSTLGVSVILENDEIFVSDSTNYYIGKTHNYIFIHHENTNSTEVIPMDRIKQLTFKSRLKP